LPGDVFFFFFSFFFFFFLAEVHSSASWTAATFTGLQTVQVLPSQMIPDDFFAHSKGNADGLINRNFVNP